MNKFELANLSTQQTSANHVKANPIFYPDERLVAFLKSFISNRTEYQDLKGIDIGFGSGRHIKLLMELGFETYGIEYTQEAINATRNHVGFNDLLKELFLGDYRSFTFPTFFDAIIAWGVVFHSEYSKIPEVLRSLSSIMATDGSMFVNFRTKQNWFCTLGELIDTNSYLLDERAREYSGYCYSFVDLPELEQIVQTAGLRIEKIEKLELWKNNLTQQNSWFICELKRR